MPNRDVHGRAGAVVGGGYAAYHAWGQPTPHVLIETAGGVLGGTIGGLLPDWIDAPTSPRHRAQAHSMAITGTLGYHMNEQILSSQTLLRSQAQACANRQLSAVSSLEQLWYAFLEFLCRLGAGAIARVLGGYASHLVLDSLTPACLPILC
jgi:hypothetical protein